MTSSKRKTTTAEEGRLHDTKEGKVNWKEWGPYLSERAWGTVREDYSPYGASWDFFPHDHARSRVYRWNEDGLAGISDDEQRLCFALALWNGQDAILKERLFGLTNPEGNHGEDVKEYYFYLDSTQTHSYMKMLYKYPQRAFPYAELVETNRSRNKQGFEYELFDTGIFNENRYFDVFIEYAKADADDILIRITAFNRGPEAADLHILPTLWFRNTWSWGWEHDKMERPSLKEIMPNGEESHKLVEARIPCQQVMTLDFLSITLKNFLWSLYMSQGDTRLFSCYTPFGSLIGTWIFGLELQVPIRALACLAFPD